MKKTIDFIVRHWMALVALLVTGGVSVLALGGVAGATGATALEDQFTSTQTSILSELGYGAALLIAILLFVIGITVLVKWARKGSKMTA